MHVLTPQVLGEAAHNMEDSGFGDSLSPHSAQIETSGCREAACVTPSLWCAVPALGCGRQAGRALWDSRCSPHSVGPSLLLQESVRPLGSSTGQLSCLRDERGQQTPKNNAA